MLQASKTVGMITQFTCISSVIFLTHREVTIIFKTIQPIDEIYDSEKNKVWSSSEGQNITNMAMQTLHIRLQLPVEITKIRNALNKYQSSFYNLTAVEENSTDFIKDNYEELTKNSPPGAKGTVEQKDLSVNAPGPPYKKTAIANVDGAKKLVKVQTNSSGDPVAEVVK